MLLSFVRNMDIKRQVFFKYRKETGQICNCTTLDIILHLNNRVTQIIPGFIFKGNLECVKNRINNRNIDTMDLIKQNIMDVSSAGGMSELLGGVDCSPFMFKYINSDIVCDKINKGVNCNAINIGVNSSAIKNKTICNTNSERHCPRQPSLSCQLFWSSNRVDVYVLLYLDRYSQVN